MTAHRHVISRRWFIPVAVTPALVITIMLAVALFFTTPMAVEPGMCHCITLYDVRR
ncbi:MAG: hypothetical protein R2727_05435 [Bacteroidales bacterium]